MKRAVFLVLALFPLLSHGQEAASPEVGLPRRLSYETACRIALEHNPQIRSALSSIESAIGERTVFRSAALPILKAQIPGGYQGPRGEADGRLFGLLLANFSQPLIDLRIPYSWQAGDLTLLVAVHNYWATVNVTMYSLRNSYIAALFEESFLVINREIIQVNSGVYEEFNQREQTGLSHDTERRRSELTLRRSQVESLPAPYRRKTALLEMSALMGCALPPDSAWLDEVELTDDLSLATGPSDFSSAIAEAKANRADLALLRTLAKVEEAEAMIAFGEMLPIFNFEVDLQSLPNENASSDTALINTSTGTTGIDSVPTNAELENDAFASTSVRYGPTGKWAVFDGFLALGNYRANKAQAKAQSVSADGLEQRLEIDIRIIQARLRIAENLLAATRQSVKAARNTADASRKGLAAPDVDVTSTQFAYALDESSANQLRIAELKAKFDRALLLARLDYVTGRNLRLQFVSPPVRRLPPEE